MKTIRVTYADGNTSVTNINGTDEEIRAYYIGQSFNFGDTDAHPADKMVKAVAVDFLRDYNAPEMDPGDRQHAFRND